MIKRRHVNWVVYFPYMHVFLEWYVCELKVEGAAFEDGRTPSIFDTFAHSGNVLYIVHFKPLTHLYCGMWNVMLIPWAINCGTIFALVFSLCVLTQYNICKVEYDEQTMRQQILDGFDLLIHILVSLGKDIRGSYYPDWAS